MMTLLVEMLELAAAAVVLAAAVPVFKKSCVARYNGNSTVNREEAK